MNRLERDHLLIRLRWIAVRWEFIRPTVVKKVEVDKRVILSFDDALHILISAVEESQFVP